MVPLNDFLSANIVNVTRFLSEINVSNRWSPSLWHTNKQFFYRNIHRLMMNRKNGLTPLTTIQITLSSTDSSKGTRIKSEKSFLVHRLNLQMRQMMRKVQARGSVHGMPSVTLSWRIPKHLLSPRSRLSQVGNTLSILISCLGTVTETLRLWSTSLCPHLHPRQAVRPTVSKLLLTSSPGSPRCVRSSCHEDRRRGFRS